MGPVPSEWAQCLAFWGKNVSCHDLWRLWRLRGAWQHARLAASLVRGSAVSQFRQIWVNSRVTCRFLNGYQLSPAAGIVAPASALGKLI